MDEYANMELRAVHEECMNRYMNLEKEILIKKYNIPSKPSKDGYYRINVPNPSKLHGRTQIAAKSIEELKNRLYAFEQGKYGEAKKSFQQVYILYLQEKLTYTKNPNKKISKQNTIKRKEQCYNRYFSGTDFELKAIDQITCADIDRIIFLNLNRYNMKERAFRELCGVLNQTFDYAMRNRWIIDNPYQYIDLTKYKDMLFDMAKNDERSHTDEEIRKILELCHERQQNDPAYMPAFALEFQILTACRRGEIPPLERSDVRDGYISITKEQLTVKAFGNEPEHWSIVPHTKNGHDRHFPIGEDLMDFLPRLYDALDQYYPNSKFLFPDPDQELGCINNNVVYRFYQRICKQLGIMICREIMKGPHSFRRKAITNGMNNSGGDAVMVSKMYGNSPKVALANYYTGFRMDNARELVNQGKWL